MNWVDRLLEGVRGKTTGRTAGKTSGKATAKGRPGGLLRRRVDVLLGLDLGTSATKVMFTIPGSSEPPQPVKWPAPGGGQGYLSPSLVGVDLMGRIVYGEAAHVLGAAHARVFRRSKMLVADRHARGQFADAGDWTGWNTALRETGLAPEVVTPRAVTAAYLAWVACHAVAEISRTISAEVGRVRVNVCVPFGQHEHAAARAAFTSAVAGAEALAAAPDALEGDARAVLERAEQACDTAQWSREHSLWQLVPEAMASFVAVVKSRLARDGVYALYDIGEGTTDVTVMEHVQRGPGNARQLYPGSRSIPKAVAWTEHQIEVRHLRGTRREVATRAVFDDWKAATDDVWRDAYATYRKEHHWVREQVRIYVAGGGSAIADFVARLDKAWTPSFGPYRVEPLPSPHDYQWETWAPFVRMSVAYGLAHDLATMIEPVFPAAVGDRTPVQDVADAAEPDQLHPYD